MESNQRHRRVSAPDKLGREIGIGGYDTITGSYLWLYDHGYVASAPGVSKPVAAITDPNELVVTLLGKKALKPYLATFSLVEVASIAATMSVLTFILGLNYDLFQLYPSLLMALTLVDLLAALAMGVVAAMAMRIGRTRHKERVSSLIDSVVDRG